MTALSPWIAAALADAEAAQRADGWLSVAELERAGHDPHDADHIARWSPEVVIAVLTVARTAEAIRDLRESTPRKWRTARYRDRMGELFKEQNEALAALAAATTERKAGPR